jgi:hypothetical protein
MHEDLKVLYHPPTLELASVRLLSVVLLPLEGLPTRPIRGSRGIVMLGWRGCDALEFSFSFSLRGVAIRRLFASAQIYTLGVSWVYLSTGNTEA